MSSDSAPAEPLIAFLDANIVLEGKPVADLPWDEVTTEGTVRVLVVPKAMEEIDAKKRDGRLGPHARAFNQLIAPSVVEGRPIVLKEANPRVELELATCSRIPWESYDELDPADGDSRIVAEAINVRDVESARRVLISHDIKPLAFAKGRGLPVHRASDAWLRPIEPSPKDKEIQRLKQQLAEFRKDEPTFEISIEVSDANPTTVYEISPLTTEQAAILTAAIRAQNPRKSQKREQFSIGLSDYDSSYDEKYDHYVAETIPKFVSAFTAKLEMLFNQRLLSVRVFNAGQIRADHLVVSVSTNDGWINERIVVVSPAGPSAPVPQPYWQHLHNNITGIRDFMPVRVGRHEFEMIRRPERTPEMEESCEDFRSGQEYHFEGVIMPSRSSKPLELRVSLTAANLRGERIETFKLEKNVVAMPASELINLRTLAFKKEFALKEEMVRLIELKRYDDIEWGNGDDDG